MVKPICLLVAVVSVGLALPGNGGVIAKRVIRLDPEQANLLQPDAWRAWKTGFGRDSAGFVCDNGTDAAVHRGLTQTVVLNQTRPAPIVAEAWSRAQEVGGGPDKHYSLYLDLVFTDGTELWGQAAPFNVGSHGWERRVVRVVPDKPIKQVAVRLLLRRHAGKAWFRDAALRVLNVPEGAAPFDGVPVEPGAARAAGFLVRDVAANSDFLTIDDTPALGLQLATETRRENGVEFISGTLRDTSARDRAVTLVYSLPIPGTGWQWWHDPRRVTDTEPHAEYIEASRFQAGANGRLSRYPLAAVTRGAEGRAITLDMGHPAFFRVAYSAGHAELYIAYDFGLTPEKPDAAFRFCTFPFDGRLGFRGALAQLHRLYPQHFQCRTPKQGVWMPFHKISDVKGWEDFGFRFKEGTNETEWDDAHGMITFRYTEPHTWWMRMQSDMPRTMQAAQAEAQRLMRKGDRRALALESCGYHDEDGNLTARMRDVPWCSGAVWSVNPSPDLAGDVTDFSNKWNEAIRDRFYGPSRKGDLDGEYVDSSEGYTTALLNFRRSHFATARTPLTFSLESRRPAQFRPLLSFEYVRALADDVHARGQLMMANGTPSRVCWLAPCLDVLGKETDWNKNGHWQPMSDRDLLFRRALCGPKPFCFLMNTAFDKFPYERVEKYMKRCLAYGVFPGFFSHEASGRSHYFRRPELYNRDRPLFKKYVPLCKRVAEAGWQPVTGARSDNPHVYVERFGTGLLTVFNDSTKPQQTTITWPRAGTGASRDLVSGEVVAWQDGAVRMALPAEDVAVLAVDTAEE